MRPLAAVIKRDEINAAADFVSYLVSGDQLSFALIVLQLVGGLRSGEGAVAS